jgi:serine-type D-Ala-D-Ala carboxypeptidase (penicillin-binding protein 5/6)
MTPRHRVERAALAVLAMLAVVIGGGAIVMVRAAAPAMTASPTAVNVVAGGSAPSFSWPKDAAAVAIPGFAITATPGFERAQPIASVTKMMTALVVEQYLPLASGASGPIWTVTHGDVAQWQSIVAHGGSNLRVDVGEQLSERQLLEGLLIHSANNFALVLVELCGVTPATFVAEMNATARSYGLVATTYVDATGFPPGNVSTPSDQLVVAEHLLADPVLHATVAMTVAAMPNGALDTTYTPMLGVHGIDGVKTGYSSAAGGCDVVAVHRQIGGVTIEFLAVVLGARAGGEFPSLNRAAREALALIDHAAASVVETTIPAGTVIGTLHAGGSSVSVALGRALAVPMVPGTTLPVRYFPVVDGGFVATGSSVGSGGVTVGNQTVLVPAVATTAIAPRSTLDRVG